MGRPRNRVPWHAIVASARPPEQSLAPSLGADSMRLTPDTLRVLRSAAGTALTILFI